MTLLPVETALARILAGVVPTAAEPVTLAAASGRVLAEPVIATRAQPPFAASSMDGFAVRSADAVAGARLRLVGESAAGRRFGGEMRPGEAVRIATGAPVPAAADAILIKENAAVEGDVVIAREAVTPHRFIRRAGLDFSVGDRLLDTGRRLGPRELALAAAANAAELRVHRRPAVAVLSIGDELVLPGDRPGADQIVASSAVALVALANAAGAQASDLGLVPDRADSLAEIALAAAKGGIDVFVTIGGASVGDHDVVRPALAAAGMALDFWRIAMRPGRPMLFGTLGAMRIIGVPGNPVSSLVCGEVFLRPLIAALLGMPPSDPGEPAILGIDLPANDTRQDYLRARLDPRPNALPVATPLPRQDSSMLRTLADADCLLIRSPLAPAAAAGSPCRIIRLR